MAKVEFYISGFAMMYMPLFHPWNMVILMYVFGLFVSIRAVIEGENTYNSRIIFLLTILGVGVFSYYQGRSHDHVLPAVAYPATLLAVIFADQLLTKWRAGKLLLPDKICVLVIMFFFVIALSVLLYSGKSLLIFKHVQQGFRSLITSDSIAALKVNIDFIKENTVFGEKVFIICEPNLDGIYYGNTGTRNAAQTPGSSELLLLEDVEKEARFLNHPNEYKLFIDFAYVPPEMIGILKDNYTVIGKSLNGMQYLRWKKS